MFSLTSKNAKKVDQSYMYQTQFRVVKGVVWGRDYAWPTAEFREVHTLELHQIVSLSDSFPQALSLPSQKPDTFQHFQKHIALLVFFSCRCATLRTTSIS